VLVHRISNEIHEIAQSQFLKKPRRGREI